jgi:hypothetical protein
MFNLGSNDKEELQENMQEIKNLIQGDEEGGASGQSGMDLDSGGMNQSQGQSNQSLGNAGQSQNQGGSFEDRVRQNHEQEQQQNQSPPGNFSTPDQESGNQQTQSQNQGQGQQPSQEQLLNQDSQGGNQQQESQRQQNQGQQQTQITESHGTASPEEPMFLREEDFLSVEEMIEEMTYLTQEMEDSLDQLKKTVNKERNTTKDALDLVQAFSQRRSEIESTIESGQK